MQKVCLSMVSCLTLFTGVLMGFILSAAHAQPAKPCTVDDIGACKFGGIEVCRDSDGNQGRCSQRGVQCLCITSLAILEEELVGTMFHAALAAKEFNTLLSTVGPSAACAKLRGLASHIDLASSRLMSLPAFPIATAEVLKKLDVTIATMPFIGFAAATSCMTSVDVSGITSRLNSVQLDLLPRLNNGLD